MNERRLHHAPILSRLDLGLVRSPGPGLGNLLFPIARSLIGRERYGGEVVYPTLRQIKLGTILRRERDSRTYGNEFRPRSLREWTGWARTQTMGKVSEHEYGGNQEGICIAYIGLGRYFYDLEGWHQLISGWINSNAILLGAVEGAYDIGIHVRLGDFREDSSDDAMHSVRQPLEWYREAHAEARKLLGNSATRTLLFTDEDPTAVAKALGIPGLELDPSRNAITAIRNLACAKVVVTSRSTFSMWAAYLGNTAAIWRQGFALQRSFPLRPDMDHFLE